MRIRRKSDGKWVEIPDGPTPEEEAEMERYKKRQAIMWMAFYDACPPEVRARWAETGRF